MKRLILIIVVINLLFFLTANNVFAQCNPTTVFTYPTPGYNFHGFVIQSATLNIAPGDEIGVFAPDGLGGEMCVGACGYTGTLPVGFQAEEDDPNTVGIKEGFAAGDPITFRIWDASENEEYVATLTYLAGDVNFASAGSTIYGQITTSAPIPTISEWGMIIMSLLLLIAGTLVIRRQKALATAQ